MGEQAEERFAVEIAEIKSDLKGVWRRIDEQLALTGSVHALTVRAERQGTELRNLLKTMGGAGGGFEAD